MKIDKSTKLKSRIGKIYTVVDIIMNSLTNEPLFYVLNNGLKIPQENIAPYGSKNPNYMYQIIGMKNMNKVTMKEILSKTMIKLKKGTGFWCLDYYPWGGDFHRLTKDVECTNYEVLKNFNDGTPSMITTVIDGKKCGFQL